MFWKTHSYIQIFWFGILSSFWASSILTWVYADIASATCPSQSGSRAITFTTFAAVFRDADEPCSANTAQASGSSFTMSTGIVAQTLYVLDHRSPSMKQKAFIVVFLWHFLWTPLCSWLFTSHAEILQFFPFLVHCCLRIWNLHPSRHRIKFLRSIVMQYRILSFSRDVFFMNQPFSLLTLLFVLWIDGLQWYNWIWSLLQKPWLFFQFVKQRFPQTLWYMILQLPLMSPTFALQSQGCLCIFRHSEQLNKFLSSLWCVRVSVSRLPFLVFLYIEWLLLFLSKRQAICDLDVMSFGFLSISHQTTFSFWRSFVQ